MEFISFLIDVPFDVMRTCLHSYVGPITWVWLLTCYNAPSFGLFSTHFLTTLHMCLGIPHLTVAHLSWCQCGHAIDDLGIHLLRCSCKSEMHCSPWYALRYHYNYHVGEWSSHVKKGFPPFPRHTWRQMDIVIIKDDFQTLVNVVIVDSTHTNLVQRVSMTTLHATIVATKYKARSYSKWTPGDDFIPFAIETPSSNFYFLTFCVHVNIIRHWQTSFVPSMLISYYKQRVSITL